MQHSLVDVVDVKHWTAALLAPPRPEAVGGAPIADHELTALLVAGHLDAAEHHLSQTAIAGLTGLMESTDPALAVSAAFTGWVLGGPGLLRGDIDRLLTLTEDRDPGRRLAGVVLASIALSNRERLEDAIDLLASAERAYRGLPAALLALQRGCRLVEVGDDDRAVTVLEAVRQSLRTADEALAFAVSRVATAVLLNLRPEAEDLWDELHGTPPAPALEERTHLRVNALAEMSDLTLAAVTAGTQAGIRSSRWPPGLLGFLGAWLRAECWADYGAIRRSRAELAARAVTQHLLPVPENWTASRADRVDLDLARRSGDATLTARAYRALWEEGPVEELRHVIVGLATTPWRADRELATLKALSRGGDLVTETAAATVVERLLGVLHDDVERDFVPEYDVSTALASVLPSAGVDSHERVAHFLADLPLAHRFLRPFAVVPEALDVAGLPVEAQERLEGWATGALTSSSDARLVAVEMLLSLARRPDRAGNARSVLSGAFRAEPSLRVALGLLLVSEEDDPTVSDYLIQMAADPHADQARDGLDAAALLAVVAARRMEVAQQVTAFVVREDVDLYGKRWLLSQLAIGPQQVAERVLSPEAVAVLDQQHQLADLPRNEALVVHTQWLAAQARARRLPSGELLHEVSALAGGIVEDRAAAAHVLGSSAGSLSSDQLVALLHALLADRDAPVAVSAVAATRRAFPDMLPDPLQRAMVTMTRSDGVARPLAAGGLLASRRLLTRTVRDRLSRHPSASVRAAVRPAFE